MSNADEKLYGFDDNFFGNILPFDATNLYVDNYYAARQGLFDTKLATAGVGTRIKLPSSVNLSVNKELEDPGLTNYLFEESATNDHSGVHQWYRWTMRPKDKRDLYGFDVCPDGNWNSKPVFAECVTATGTCYDKPRFNNSLDPCYLGWNISILNPDSEGFPLESTSTPNASSTLAAEFGNNIEAVGCQWDVGTKIFTCDGSQSGIRAIAADSLNDIANAENLKPTAYQTIEISVPEFARYISFDYRYQNSNAEDTVLLFLNDKQVWKMPDVSNDNLWKTSNFVKAAVDSGVSTLTLAFNKSIQSTSAFELGNIVFTVAIDSDGDGYADDEDVFPADPSEWLDSDEYGIGNSVDTDDDNDGVLDANDAFPLDPNESIDTDSDGSGNNIDTDDDNDGFLDDNDNCQLRSNPRQIDTDSDGHGDACDLDDDNDGMPDAWEARYGLNIKSKVDASFDNDGDGRTNLQEYIEGTNPNVKDEKIKTNISSILQLLLLDEPFSNPWSQISSVPAIGERELLNFSVGSKGYVGISSGYSSDRGKLWEFDPATKVWSRKADLPTGFVFQSPSFVISGKVYLIIGNQTYEYNPSINKWIQKADVPGEDKRAGFGFSVNNRGYIGGGFYNGFNLWEYDPSSNHWTKKKIIPI